MYLFASHDDDAKDDDADKSISGSRQRLSDAGVVFPLPIYGAS